ncbi:aminotransferase class V-fold PLP-dependent enzyme [Aureimonas fodinaquatilis]|uniref:Aminotransferase class V-fold PLP-dependent enzyme n=1 Tax=Aureimonas fodinaquatilis TaxID=2565783 RepID=A0A5B0DXS4_9HYPH|nr:aminotransferase class V-fold PLP-dependent enzyme [Aureimonas fodinaquatilis]KAA0970360.1 aminotransferase class V-fold PLP-dependent enzyme [Aureimonas fodinaquatilis]
MIEAISQAEVEGFRSATPGTGSRIHLNNAGAALMTSGVVSTVVDHLRLEAEIGGYEARNQQAERVENVYGSVSRLLNADPDEIALAENATVAWQWAFYAQTFKPGDRILTTTAEYAANYLAYLQVSRRTGAVISVVPDNANGELDPVALEAMIDERVRLISITWVPTNGGLVNPAAAVGKIAKAHKIPYLLDACQAVGQIPVDVAELGCDMLTATGRKFLRGPRGTGFLYISRNLMQQTEPAMIDMYGARWAGGDRYELRPDARRFETWEANYAARLGLGVAVEQAIAIGLPRIEQRVKHLAALLRAKLIEVPRVTVHDMGKDPAAIVTFTLDGLPATDVAARLLDNRVNVSVSSPTSTPVDSTKRHLPDLVRASPHYYNTEDEIEAMIDIVRSIPAG